MLDTVLKIGKSLRNSKDHLKHFKYIKPCPPDTDKETILRLNIPVKEDFSFDWDNISVITNENEIQNLYYLTFKTSDNDNNPIKYIFGDIFYGLMKGQEKNGWYKTERKINKKGEEKNNSFLEGDVFIEKILNQEECSELRKFRAKFTENRAFIENILKNHLGINYWFNNALIENNKLIKLLSDNKYLKELTAHSIFQSINSNTHTRKKEFKKLLKVEAPIWEEIKDDQNKIATLLKSATGRCFIHFEFPKEKNWTKFDFVDNIISQLKVEFTSSVIIADKVSFVFDKSFVNTLCSGDKKNDIQFPSFDSNQKYKSKTFDSEKLENLFYGLDYCTTGHFYYISGPNVKIYVLPIGEYLSDIDYIDFKNHQNENIINKSNVEYNEPFFRGIDIETDNKITSFDFVFAKDNSPMPDTNLIEISGIKKSTFRETKNRIKKIAREVHLKKIVELNTTKDLPWPTITRAYINILGNPQKDRTGKVNLKVNPKYNTHILKVLPKIYTQNYKTDPILLPALIRNAEFSIREGDSKFVFLKYDLEFLLKIQNTKTDKFMEIINSKSYQVGFKIGKMAKPLKKAINSFEKSYVGLISRRTNTHDECLSFLNEIDEKLVRHGKAWGQMSAEIHRKLIEIPLKEYDKEKIVFGFFEGYFKYEAKDKKKDFFKRLEKLITDNKDNEELQNEVEQLNNLIEQIKSE